MSRHEPNGGRDTSRIDIDYEDLHLAGERPDIDSLFTPTLVDKIAEKSNDPVKIPDDLQAIFEETNFEVAHGRWRILRDVVGMIKKREDGSNESYLDKIIREERKGKSESALFGVAELMGQRAVIYAMNWDYFSGTLGAVAGEKFQAASDLAISEKLPFVGIYSTAGVRQQENIPGLFQMTRMAMAIDDYKEQTNQLHTAVLLGHVWGGVSASAVPRADVVVAVRGTRYGFAGPVVIKAENPQQAIPSGAQSGESNMLSRNIDIVVPRTDLVPYLGSLIAKTTLPAKDNRLTENNRPHIRVVAPDTIGRTFDRREAGLYLPGFEHEDTIVEQLTIDPRPELKAGVSRAQELMTRYGEIANHAGRVDTDFVLRYGFDSFSPLYNALSYEEGGIDYLSYPSTIAAIAKIGEQPFLVVGNQHSYKFVDKSVKKIRSAPEPQDYEYVVRVLEMGERLELPAVFLTDTLGAKASLHAEERGQSRAISDTIVASNKYPHPVITLNMGGLGSGGGLATTPIGEAMGMLRKSLAFVSEPTSATSMLYGTSEPSPEMVSTTLASMKASSEELSSSSQGALFEVVEEGKNPYETAANIANFISSSFVRIHEDYKNPKARMKARRERRRQIRVFDIHKENN